jgi:hypothetical protein
VSPKKIFVVGTFFIETHKFEESLLTGLVLKIALLGMTLLIGYETTALNQGP